jgi:CBS-domain-containing membrane protein
MRTLISLNGWWGFFFRRNSRILAFTAILLVVFVTDLGGASDWPNGQLVTAKNQHYDDGITVKMDFASNQVMMISEAELLMTEHRIRHVPITRDGKLVGIVSIGDVVKRLLEKYEQEAELIKQFINS